MPTNPSIDFSSGRLTNLSPSWRWQQFLIIPFLLLPFGLFAQWLPAPETPPNDFAHTAGYPQFDDGHDLVVPIGTFLGNWTRNYYGNAAPSKLDIIWKKHLGSGKTVISRSIGTRIWAGAGWTGQPLYFIENDTAFLIQGAYDHHLKKIYAETGKIRWEYAFDDVIKGTGTFWVNTKAKTPETRYVLLQGSRLGVGNYLDSDFIPSYRAISYLTGKELWRLDVKWDASYSRDVDASCVMLNDTLYIGLENGLFTVIDPDPEKASLLNGMLQPLILQEEKLYVPSDSARHRGNLVTEASPALLNNKLYVNSGSGHVYGYNLQTRKIDWDFFVGADMDGSAAVTSDDCILVPVEKQYIDGPGGVLKLDPSRPPEEAVLWYAPTRDTNYVGWKGGIIGSVGINESYRTEEKTPHLAAFVGVDGFLYVVDQRVVDTQKQTTGPDGKKRYPQPKQVFRMWVGPSISTPIFVGNKLIVAGYEGLYLFAFNQQLEFTLLDHFKDLEFEATPIAWDERIFIASRNGYLYCLGEKTTRSAE